MKIPYCLADSFAAVINSAYDGFAKAINKISGCFIDKNIAGKSWHPPAAYFFSPTRHHYSLHNIKA